MTYSEINALKKCIIENDLTFEAISPKRLDVNFHYDEEVKMRFGDQEFIIPVDNEYSFVELNNPVVFLHLILEEIEYIEDSKDLYEWTGNMIQLTYDEKIVALYNGLKEVAPQIRAIVGKEVRAIPHFDIELNTGLAKALRAAHL
ncbi:MAG: hypothetical protein ED557_10590 [Balneola sp.]|nr:MAG: hypothetical protein ED557_10590 [Balneola sp.]